jgi:iron complex transport system ATP-binding protein
MINIQNLSFKIHEKYLLKNIDCKISTNELLVIMGANGAGKTTLLKMMSGLLHASSGKLLIDQKLIEDYSTLELSHKRAVLSQHYEIAFPLTAKEIILMGRYPFFQTNPSELDKAIVDEVIAQMEITKLANRNYQTLSGGEAQKVQMCRVLAQMRGVDKQNKFLLLDEPVSHLDIKFQYQLLEIAQTIKNEKTAVVAVLHDINLALKFADRILFMKDGVIVHEHLKSEKLELSVIKNVFDVHATMIDLPEQNRQWVCF